MLASTRSLRRYNSFGARRITDGLAVLTGRSFRLFCYSRAREEYKAPPPKSGFTTVNPSFRSVSLSPRTCDLS